MNEGKLLLNKSGVDLDIQILQKPQEQKNFRNNSIDIQGSMQRTRGCSSFERGIFQKSRPGLSKRTHKINKHIVRTSHELNEDDQFRTKFQMNEENNIFSSIEPENTTSKTCESSEISNSDNTVSNNPILHHGMRKGIKKYDSQQERNESLKSSYNNESVENKDDSWNFSSEDQFQRLPSITEIEQEEQHKQYYIHNLVGYISGYLSDLFMAQMYLSHFVQMYDNLRKSKSIQQPSFTTQLPPLPSGSRKSLIVDLDETLVHCNESPLLKSDFFIPIHMNGKNYQAGISIRPYAQEFLRNMAEHFEIIIYTASNQDYANKIIDYLDPTGTSVKYRLFREHCIQISPGCHLKDLRILNRDLKDIVLIDNSAYSFAYQINNGIPIIPYLDNKNDDELLLLQYYLKELLTVHDVREVNKRTFHLEVIQNSDSIQQAVVHLNTFCNRF